MDDIFILGKYKKDIVYIKQLFEKCFKFKNLEKIWVVFGIQRKRYGYQMTLNQLQYATVILKLFLNNIFLSYLILIELNTIYKLANTKREILTEERNFCYL